MGGLLRYPLRFEILTFKSLYYLSYRRLSALFPSLRPRLVYRSSGLKTCKFAPSKVRPR